MENTVSRRGFLTIGGSLVVTFSLQGCATSRIDPQLQSLEPSKSVDKGALDAYLRIDRNGHVTAYTGKVDLGTGIRTAIAQMVADELDVAFSEVTLVMGDTWTTVDQGITGSMVSISYGGVEMRKAAATARRALLLEAARRLEVTPETLTVVNGQVSSSVHLGRQLGYGELIPADGFALVVDPKIQFKSPGQYRYVGKSIPRVDIPDKVTGKFTYVHDVRLPGMLHARVLRPDDLGATLVSFDDSEARKVDGFIRTVRQDNFLAVVAESEWASIKAARNMRVAWSPGTGLPEKATIFDDWRRRKVGKEEVTQNVGDAASAMAASARRMHASYAFSVQTHASLGPSCAVASYESGRLVVWTASQASHSLHDELVPITRLPKSAIRVVYVDGSGCYGRNGHEDATADAALISVLIGRPIRVQWMREDETARAPKSPPRAIDLAAGLDAAGNVTAWTGEFFIALNHIAPFKSLDFPLLAATETGIPRPGNWVGYTHMNSAQPYKFPNIRVNTRHLIETPFRSAHLRSPGRIENTFANESFVDEIAHAVGMDPAEYRLRNIKDPRGEEVVKTAMKRAGWKARVGHNGNSQSEIAKGRGIAYLRYNNTITYVTAIADVEVDRKTGHVTVTRVCVAQDCGQVINPDGARNQAEGGVLQTVSRSLMEEVTWDSTKVTSVDWASYPILRSNQIPQVDVDLIDRPAEPPWGVGEASSAVVPAAIGNAIFDATGARLRLVPFTPERVVAGINAARAQAS